MPKLLPGKTGKAGLLKRLVGWAKANPKKATGATVGGTAALGAAAAIPGAAREGRKLEAEIMQEYTGAPGGKFTYAELEEFSQRKKYLGEKIAMCKLAYGPPSDNPFLEKAEGGFASGLGGGVAKAGLEALGKMIRGTATSLKERMVLDKKREAIVDHVMQHDPIVSIQERAQPGSTIQAYSTMVKFAPTLSTDPNVVTSFLREASQSEGGINPLTVQQLAKTEESINKALGRMR
ncbi:MAG: hypothetical protein DRP83_01605 [Planctomycetota bacterium]|nr:MAG: hypothetical protein DRP83_01605 [Planctomycetota bacterium]